MNSVNCISFYINDKKHTAKLDGLNINTSLNSYLRDNLYLTGTKRMCLEGGCGVCIVVVQKKNIYTGDVETLAVNSCLVSIFSCFNWSIYTIEGLGTQSNPHPIQKVLTKFNGTQCGFCSPGMVMNMFALKETKNPTMEEVENSFGGNICRCTGYRSIMSAFKSISKDVTQEYLGTDTDIEELQVCKKRVSNNCNSNCKDPLLFKLLYNSWIKVFLLSDLLQVIKTLQSGDKKSTFAMVAGNTGKGVNKTPTKFDVYIDINNVKELNHIEVLEDRIVLGGNTTLTKTIELFKQLAKSEKKFGYLNKVADHIDLIGNVPVRNIGTLAGNLMLKHQNNNFASDIFVILETIGAKLTIVDINNKETYGTPEDFLKINMSNKVIKTITIPGFNKYYHYISYKIMPRSQNAYSLINCGFLLEIIGDVVRNVRIVFGNINDFVHAAKAEEFLVGKDVFDNKILQKVFEVLDEELPDKTGISISLFYKFILGIAGKPGGDLLKRNVSKGCQEFEVNQNLYPVGKPTLKLEGLAQTTGETKYIADMPDLPHQLFAAFVLAKAPAHSRIDKINTDKVLKIEGVVAFLDKNAIPGRNTFTPKTYHDFIIACEEELFCSGVVQYYHQPIGIIVAKSHDLAETAADLVEVTYKLAEVKPLTKIRDILTANAKHKIVQNETIPSKTKGDEEKFIIKGTVDLNWQYHFHMENHCCNAVPTEDGLDLYPSSQWMDLVQNAAAVVLDIPANKVNVTVKRLGGGFGGKIIRSSQISTACALAAYTLQKPVKMWLPIEKNLQIIGKRNPLSCDYEAATDDHGVIQYLNNLIYTDYGVGLNEEVVMLLKEGYLSSYNTSSWFTNIFLTHSDMHPSCYMRAPGTLEGLATAEAIMEHIAVTIGMDPLDFRLANLRGDDDLLIKYMVDFIDWADIEARKKAIKLYNQNNKWTKKGLSVIPMVYPLGLFFAYNVLISVYHMDGTVAISHGGIEVGQGINTKAAQVCAYKLGIPIEKITMKPTNNIVSANVSMTGASLTSETVCYAIMKACDILLKRMEPIKKELQANGDPNPTWEKIVKECVDRHIDLTVTSQSSPDEKELDHYNVYAVCAAEVEVDALTGQYIISRVDLLEDVGSTLNPTIDIGQIEGAFVMGLGYFLTEEIVISEDGEILSNNTWTYKPPGVKDIPVDFRLKFPPNSTNSVGVLHSKSSGEPGICLAVTVPLAIRQAVAEIREYFDPTAPKWFMFDGPTTVEQIFTNCLHDYKSYTI